MGSYSSESHEETAGGEHLEIESHCNPLLPTMRGPIKSAWGLKVSSFRYQGLWKISLIPNPSPSQARQVEMKQGLKAGTREKGRGLRNPHGVGRQGSHAPLPPTPPPTASCHLKLSKHPLPLTHRPPGPGDMCKY